MLIREGNGGSQVRARLCWVVCRTLACTPAVDAFMFPSEESHCRHPRTNLRNSRVRFQTRFAQNSFFCWYSWGVASHRLINGNRNKITRHHHRNRFGENQCSCLDMTGLYRVRLQYILMQRAGIKTPCGAGHWCNDDRPIS